MRTCSFCNKEIEEVFENVTGKMCGKVSGNISNEEADVKKDGSIYFFCSSKCEKNMIKLGRVPRKVKWVKE